MTDALPCPFCGFTPDVDDADFCYPNNRDRTNWTCKCYETGGGCGAEGPYADSRDAAITAWNRTDHTPGSEGSRTRHQLPLFTAPTSAKRVRKPSP